MCALCNKRVAFDVRQNPVWRLGMKKVIDIVVLSFTDCSGSQGSFIYDYIFADKIIIVIASIWVSAEDHLVEAWDLLSKLWKQNPKI